MSITHSVFTKLNEAAENYDVDGVFELLEEHDITVNEFSEYAALHAGFTYWNQGRRYDCQPDAAAQYAILDESKERPAISTASLAGGTGRKFEEVYEKLGKPKTFDLVGGNGVITIHNSGERIVR